MRTLLSSCIGILLSLSSLAQGWQMPQLPQTPQSSFFTPAMQQPVLSDNNTQPVQSSRPNSLAENEADRQRVKNEQLREATERYMIQDDINELNGVKSGKGYAPAMRPGDPDAAAYLQAYNELNDMLTGKRPASLKRAVFLVENAYYETS